MRLVQRLEKPVFTMYLVWVVALTAHAVAVFVNSDWLASLPTSMSNFVIQLFVAAFGAHYILGAALAWLTDAGRLWARRLFIVFCFVLAIDCFLGTFAIGPLYENIPRAYGLFRGPISFVVWCCLLWLAWSTKPNTAVKRDAPQAARPLP